jgi:hypothetical protein
MTHMALATDKAALRVVYDDEEALSLLDLNDRIYELGCLVMVNRLIIPTASAQTGQQIGFSIDPSSVLDAGEELRATQVAAIQRRSPLEIIFYVGASVSTGVYTGRRLLALYNSYQDSRVHKAKSDLAVEVYESLLERIESQKFVGPPERQQTTELIDGAAKAIASINKMELIEGDDQA